MPIDRLDSVERCRYLTISSKSTTSTSYDVTKCLRVNKSKIQPAHEQQTMMGKSVDTKKSPYTERAFPNWERVMAGT